MTMCIQICRSWNPWNLSIRYILFQEKKTPNDDVTPQRQSQFTPKMKANAVPRLLSSLVWIDQYNKCSGMTSFMEFMDWLLCVCLVQSCRDFIVWVATHKQDGPRLLSFTIDWSALSKQSDSHVTFFVTSLLPLDWSIWFRFAPECWNPGGHRVQCRLANSSAIYDWRF